MVRNQIERNARIAAYLRKSREDERSQNGDTLEKHRKQLAEFIEANQFNNVTYYEEVESGSSIAGRPVFSKLLAEIEAGVYDAVLVTDQDRLSRGDTMERGIIERAFILSGTLLLLPTGEIINFEDASQKMLAGIKSEFAHYELNQIKKRMKQGKQNAVRLGRPHSGNPPYGYTWDKNTKSCVINEEQRSVYRIIVSWYLDEGLSANAIAERLNARGVRTSSGRGTWSGEVVQQLLANEFHRGNVVYGKYKAVAKVVDGKTKYINKENHDPSSIIITKGLHEPMKTDEEHQRIVERIEYQRTHNNYNRTGRKNTFRLSGLCYCPHCGKSLAVGSSVGRAVHVRKCLKKSSTRTAACDISKGLPEEIVFGEVMRQLKQYRDELFSPIDDEEDDPNDMSELISVEQNAIQRLKRRLANAKEMRLDGDISSIEFKTIKAETEAAILRHESELNRIESIEAVSARQAKESKREDWTAAGLERIFMEELSPSEVNDLLRKIVARIEIQYVREEGGEGGFLFNIIFK